MKNSCLFMLALLFGLGGFYYWYLSGTELHDKWWIGPLLSLSVVSFFGNLQGIYFAIRQKMAAGRPETQWKDGEFVGCSGRVQALSAPIEAPFSGKKAVIVEYELKRVVRSGDSDSKVKCINGMLMTPCAVQTKRRSVKLVGFPLMANMTPEILSDETCYQNAARYILNTKFEELPANPIAIIKKLGELLADEDGDLKADFKDKKFYLDQAFDEEWENEDKPEGAEIVPVDPAARQENVYKALIGDSYDLEENTIEQGQEVTVFGTYRANRQAIDIGSGLKNLQHTIQKGKLEEVIFKNLRKSIIFTIIFGGICIYSHIYVARLVGFNI
jgi:hypothetical protein